MSEASTTIPSLATYYLLGRSGLRVSPLCLGTMTFGVGSGWGSEPEVAEAVFRRYIEAGGNFIDTADLYTGGESEALIGRFMQEMGNRDALVVATKCTFNYRPGDPNAGGNGRKHIMESVEHSLRRLQTDYIDLYWLHAWDGITPMEEVLHAMHTLVEQGKIRYVGLSDVPAWYFSRLTTMAESLGRDRIVGLQLEYSLVERGLEYEYADAAVELGAGICPWSPLGSGMLTGKYTRTEAGAAGEGRLQQMADSPNPVFQKFTDKNFDIVDAVLEVAEHVGKSPAQVALNWITKRPGITSTIIGASKVSQLEDNLAALEFDLPEDAWTKLDEVSRPLPIAPYYFFDGRIQSMMTGGTTVQPEPSWFRK